MALLLASIPSSSASLKENKGEITRDSVNERCSPPTRLSSVSANTIGELVFA